MIRNTLLLGLAVTVVASIGCRGPFRRSMMLPFGPRCVNPHYCDDGMCGPACGPVCEPDCGPACGPACGPVCGPVCGPPRCPVSGPFCGGVCEPECCPPCEPACGPACGPACFRPCGPLAWVANLFRCPLGGCGETYWGDWLSEPPDCCDPCDACGNWTGGACGPAGCGGYAVGGYAGTPASGGCAECGQVGTAPAGGEQIVAQSDRAVRATSAPTVAPRQAWRPRRTASPVQRY